MNTISIRKITKGNNSAKNVGGVNVINLCMSSGYALYLCRVHEIILNGIKVIERTRFLCGKLQKGIIPQKCRWSDRCLSLHIAWSCFIFLPSFVKLSQTVSKL